MVAYSVRPLGFATGTATIFAIIENYFLGSLPAVVLFSTIVGPFIPLVASALSRRRILTQDDAHRVFESLYEEIEKNREQILSAERSGPLPMFQRQELDQIRRGARYSILKTNAPAVEKFCELMDYVYDNQGKATETVNRIIKEMVRTVLQYDGDGISFHGKTWDGSPVNLPSAWIPALVFRGLNPLDHYRHQGFEINSVGITRDNSIVGSIVADDERYRRLWDGVEKKANEDPQITTLRETLPTLPTVAVEAETQVLNEIRKSRRIW